MTTIFPRINGTSYGPFVKCKHWGFKGFTELMSTHVHPYPQMHKDRFHTKWKNLFS
jgi:hypothetical protein